MILRQSGAMTAALVERLAPEDLWELFQQVVPPAPVRPQGGGHRRRGDREVLAAIIFVATSGCTWNQLPSGFGLSGVTAFRRFTEWTEARVWAKLHRLVLDELGSRGGWTGRGARSTLSASGERVENPPDRRSPGPAPVDRHLCRESPRQPGPDPAGPRHPAHPFTSRSPTPEDDFNPFDLRHKVKILPLDASEAPLHKEMTALEHELSVRGYAQALGHYQAALKHFSEQDHPSSNGQLRTAFEDLIVNLTVDHAGYKDNGRANQGGLAIKSLQGGTGPAVTGKPLPEKDGGTMV